MADREDSEGEVPGALTDRREFLRKSGSYIGAGVGAYVAGLPGALAVVSRATQATAGNVVTLQRRRYTALETLNLSAFSGQLNTRFTFETGDGVVEAVLVEAKGRLAGGPGHEVIEDCFSIVFRGAADQPLAQGTFPVRNRSLGTFDLFVVPIREEGGYIYYEAVFNRLRQDVDRSRL